MLKKPFKDLSKRLGVRFKKSALLTCALTHRSVGGVNNERLEFLGDAVLGLVIAEALYQHASESSEGWMSQRRAALVNGKRLAQLAETLGVREELILSPGERRTGGAARTSILAGAMEAIIGAIYLDAGLEKTRACILQWLGASLDEVCQSETAGKGPKSLLQEYAQARRLGRPTYKVVEVAGQPHQQWFCIDCKVGGLDYISRGEASSRRKAEQAAAKAYLEQLAVEKND